MESSPVSLVIYVLWAISPSRTLCLYVYIVMNPRCCSKRQWTVNLCVAFSLRHPIASLSASTHIEAIIISLAGDQPHPLLFLQPLHPLSPCLSRLSRFKILLVSLLSPGMLLSSQEDRSMSRLFVHTYPYLGVVTPAIQNEFSLAVLSADILFKASLTLE